MSQQNKPIAADIRAISHDGRGIAQIDGKTVFIEDALPGEKVLFTYTKRHGKFDEGRSVTLLEKSAERVDPKCQHFKICGGCSLQHIHPETQIRLKQQALLEQLQHFGGVAPQEVLPPLQGPHWGYRQKARLGVKYVAKKQITLVGFREKNSRYLADLQYCEILHPDVSKLLPALKEFINHLSAYQHIAQIEVAVGEQKVALIFRHLEALVETDLAALRKFAKSHHLELYLQSAGPESIKRLWPEQGTEFLSYQLPEQGLEFLFYPTDFTQVNLVINQAMVSRALELLSPTPQERVLDLFCGLGNFTLPIAKQCAEVVGVEGSATTLQRAKQNAEHNRISNATFYCTNLADNFDHEEWAKQKFDKILLDPPRCGAYEIIQHFPRLGAPKHIVYISCNPATLARDAGELVTNQGYTLTKAGIMDMFPHTNHVEAIALFKKVKSA